MKSLLSEAGPHALPTIVRNVASIVLKVEQPLVDQMNISSLEIWFRPELGFYPTGSVFRLFNDFSWPAATGDGKEHFSFECFMNPASPSAFTVLRSLSNQIYLPYHVIDQNLAYRYTKQIVLAQKINTDLRRMLGQAIEHNNKIPIMNYPTAQQAMREDTNLEA
jgi:hypothetical protein